MKNRLPSWDEMLPWDVAMPGVLDRYWSRANERSESDRQETFGDRRELYERALALRFSALVTSGAQTTSSDRDEVSLKAAPKPVRLAKEFDLEAVRLPFRYSQGIHKRLDGERYAA